MIEKKKRKKKANALQSSAVAPSEPPPPRVTNNIGIPIRHQIRWAQAKKEADKNAGNSFRKTNVKRTSYRKNLG